MAVIYRPRLMTLFLHQRAIASCMYLMRAYTARDDSSFNGLLDHAFGFLVLHVLALILQAGMLHSFHSDWLKSLPLLLGPSRKYEWNIKAPALHIEFICSLANYISSDMPGRVDAQSLSAPYRFEWCEGTWGLDRACLPSVGGFSFRDAEFILQQLFGSRKTFLECCLLPSAPGWTMLMIVLHLHIKEQSLRDRRIRTLWKHQHDIVYRYMLISGVGADGLLERVGASFRSSKFNSELEGRSSVVDIQDAQTMQKAHTRKFYPRNDQEHQRRLSYVIEVNQYLSERLAKHPSIALNIGETTMEIIWDVLVNINYDEERRWAEVDLFLMSSLRQVWAIRLSEAADFMPPETIALLHKTDAVNMLGRYLLFPYYIQNNVSELIQLGPHTDPTASRGLGVWAVGLLGDNLEQALQRPKTPRMLDDFYPDWYKVLTFLRQGICLYSPNSGSSQIATDSDSEAAWLKLGSGLGFTQHIKQGAGQYVCMYARCPTPVGARFQCGSESYCSARCQAA
ncbi:hypothetical protein FRC12_016767 [Ceratobasidium sp. 428]|nr:hypothetical protein FRC12_016767 [Ceratobasidium sp. 428]